jgi:hypothetical protein
MGPLRDDVTVSSCLLLGQTSQVRATGRRFGCNAISAIPKRGNLALMVFQGRFAGHLFVQFMHDCSGSPPEGFI